MEKWNSCSSLVLLACLSFSMIAKASDGVGKVNVASVFSTEQSKEIVLRGTVLDKDGVGLPGASVAVEGTTNGTVTDMNGNYQLKFSGKKGQKIIYSFIGMIPQVYAYDGTTSHNVVLESDDIALDDVVVIGYGSKNKKSLTSSISSMDKKEMERLSATSTSVDNLLAGTIKGVQTTQTSGEPGAAIKINVRGTTSPYPNLLSGHDSNIPLFVIDGVPMFTDNTSLNPLLNIAPIDIESIDVLKDAAATAIYGSRGANGVIIVKTKGGHRGEKVSVEAGYTLSIGNPAKQYDPLSTSEYKDLQDKILRRTATAVNEGWSMLYDPTFLQRYGKVNTTYDPDWGMVTGCEYLGIDDSKYGTADTDWAKEVQNKNAVSHQYNVAIRGGSEKTNYSFSFNGINQEGTFINDNLERYGTRMSIDTELTKWLKFGSIVNYSYSKRKTGLSGAEMAMPSEGYWMVQPDITARDAAGNFNTVNYTGYMMGSLADMEMFGANPVAELELRKSQYTSDQFLGNAYFDINVLKGLKLHADINLVRYAYKSSQFNPKALSRATYYYGVLSEQAESNLSKSTATYTTTNINFRADYNLNIGNHAMSAMFGYSADRSWDESDSHTYEGFPNDEVLNNQASANKVLSHEDSYLRGGLNSLYGRVTYDYASRYLLEASLRGDASSKFGPENQWGVFPAVSLGWRINNEPFLKNVEQISDLKLRLSWGKTGSTNIPDFAYKQFYVGGINYGPSVGVTLKNMLPNKEIRWEMTSEYNVGADFGLFDNRLYGSLDLYYRSTDGSLAPAPYVMESGFSLYYANIIDTSNKGIEFNIGGDVVKTKDFVWNTNFNISANRSKLKRLNGANVDTYLQSFFVEGKPIGCQLGYKTDGIFQSADEIAALDEVAQSKGFNYYQESSTVGDLKMMDTNGDGTITVDDRVVVVNPEAKCFGGWTNVFTYKDFSLSCLLQFRCGGEAYYDNLAFGSQTILGQSVLREYYEGMWTPENPNGIYPQIVSGYNMMGVYNMSTCDRYVFKTSYLRMKNITLSYNLPKVTMNKLGIQGASVFVSATNLFTVTDWPGLDPEMVGTSTTTAGSSTDAYPMCRTFSMGLKLQF